MVAHVGALHDHVHVVQVGKDRILQALTVVGADRFQNIRVLLNDRFFCLMMDGEQTCPAIMYILRTGMLQHELPVGQRIEDMVEIFIQTEHGCNVIHCAGGPLLFHNGAQIRIDRSKCAGIERFQTDMGFQNFAQVAGLLHLLAVDQADKASPFGEHIHSTISSQAMQCFTHGNTAAFKLGSKAHLAELFAGEQIQKNVAEAGIEVVEARITYLAYAPEIAAVMLQRQQASAIIDARKMIVDGAVGMVEMALERLNENKVVELDDERKAAMVSNLLVVLCGNRDAQPIVNSGSLY